MNKILIDSQRNSNATCVIVKDGDQKELEPRVVMKANVSDKFLFLGKRPPFADKIDEVSQLGKICYFVITGLDEVSIERQNRFVGLVKDREFEGYDIPKNCIIVFTVKDNLSLKNVSPQLNHFSVVAF